MCVWGVFCLQAFPIWNMAEDKPKLINIYCDESRQSGHRYMVLGGIWIPKDSEIEFSDLCHKFRSQEPHLLTAFLKWGKATSKKFLPHYKQFADIFFSYKRMHFNSMIIDTHKVDYAKYHEGDRELAFYKFYFFLISRNINPQRRYLVILDRRNNRGKNRLQTLKYKLNSYFQSRGLADDEVVVDVQARDSRLYNQLQMADIFIGYLGYKKEGYQTSEAKVELSQHISARRLGLLAKIRWLKFNVWEWSPSQA